MRDRIVLGAICLGLCAIAARFFNGFAPDSPASTIPESASVDSGLVGSYYMGDGRGLNQRLTLNADGSFQCRWTGCLGHYGSTTGYWAREGETVHVSVASATDMFLNSPLLNMKVVKHDGRQHLIPADRIGVVDEESSGWATFSPTY